MYRRYNNIKKLVSDEGKNYYLNPIYPDIPDSEEDIYVISTVSEVTINKCCKKLEEKKDILVPKKITEKYAN